MTREGDGSAGEGEGKRVFFSRYTKGNTFDLIYVWRNVLAASSPQDVWHWSLFCGVVQM